MTEFLFYHLERQPVEAALPPLLEKCLERQWRAVVQFGSAERMEAVDARLWTWREESFLPHGTEADGNGEVQPVYLTTDDANPNAAGVRFIVDRAVPGDLTSYTRVVFMFDGRDEEAVAEARTHWKTVTSGGSEATYWQQDESGRWVKKA